LLNDQHLIYINRVVSITRSDFSQSRHRSLRRIHSLIFWKYLWLHLLQLNWPLKLWLFISSLNWWSFSRWLVLKLNLFLERTTSGAWFIKFVSRMECLNTRIYWLLIWVYVFEYWCFIRRQMLVYHISNLKTIIA
jgi:hypothetical protein